MESERVSGCGISHDRNLRSAPGRARRRARLSSRVVLAIAIAIVPVLLTDAASARCHPDDAHCLINEVAAEASRLPPEQRDRLAQCFNQCAASTTHQRREITVAEVKQCAAGCRNN